MTTEIDHNAIKTAIVGILRGDAALYDADNADGTKMVSIEVGRPNDAKARPSAQSYIYVTGKGMMHRMTPKSNVIADAFEAIDHSVDYAVVFGTVQGTAKTAEASMDAFEKIILQDLEADNQLKNGGSANVDTSYPTDIIETEKGDVVWQERKIVLFCKKETG